MAVSARSDDAKVFAQTLIVSAAADEAGACTAQQQVTPDQQDRAHLLATVTPRWIQGVWLPAGFNDADCANGQAYALKARYRLAADKRTGV